ncbi:MAG: hypothetical protein HQM10_27255 [Candidatus Riflebacteria bacterium]|nr:hypothetical protein [Candidatus Riflebacteria bacterium]
MKRLLLMVVLLLISDGSYAGEKKTSFGNVKSRSDLIITESKCLIDAAGKSSEVTIEVTEGVGSLQIEIHGNHEDFPIVEDFFRVEKGVIKETLVTPKIPSGADERLVRAAQQFSGAAGQFLGKNRCMCLLNRYASLVVPNNPNVKLSPGTWKLRVKDMGENKHERELRIRTILRTKSVSFARRILPVHFHFSGARGWSAENYLDNQDFQAYLSELKKIFLSANIDLRIDSAYNLNSSTGNAGNKMIIEDNDQLFNLLESGSATYGLKIYLVDELMYGASGISAGIGGPTISSEFKMGGVVATLPDYGHINMFASALAHEMGHYLGLFHIKEYGTVLQDQLSDTNPDDDQGVNIMSAQGSNDPWSTRLFSPQQAQIMARHPLVMSLPSPEVKR